jgi:acetyl-CoA synthetase
MIPELPTAMLACARMGAPHTVSLAGFSPDAIGDRVNDCQAKVIITADASYRRDNLVPLKDNIDEAEKDTPSVQRVVVMRRVGSEKRPVAMYERLDV